MNELHARPLTLLLIAASVSVTLACDVKVNDKGFALNLGRSDATDEWTRTYDLPAGGRLEIVNGNGLIEAIRADGPRVEVRAERRARAGSDEEAARLLKTLEMREEVSATRVKIEAIGGSGPSGFLRNGFDIQYHVRVPDGLAVSFRTANGGIRFQNVNGQIAGATTNGGVQADLSSISGDVTLATTNGGIRLDLPLDVKANLDVACVNGGINIDDQFKLGAGSGDSRCRVSVVLNGGGPRVSAATVNGGIRIRARGSRQSD